MFGIPSSVGKQSFPSRLSSTCYPSGFHHPQPGSYSNRQIEGEKLKIAQLDKIGSVGVGRTKYEINIRLNWSILHAEKYLVNFRFI